MIMIIACCVVVIIDQQQHNDRVRRDSSRSQASRVSVQPTDVLSEPSLDLGLPKTSVKYAKIPQSIPKIRSNFPKSQSTLRTISAALAFRSRSSVAGSDSSSLRLCATCARTSSAACQHHPPLRRLKTQAARQWVGGVWNRLVEAVKTRKERGKTGTNGRDRV